VTPHTRLGRGAEFDRIRAIWERLGSRAALSGDDCALFPFGQDLLAISTDMAVEGTHFRAGWLSPRELGWRIAAAALSDLAAVAATPTGAMASIGVPEVAPDDLVTDVMDGVADAAHGVGALVVGGDLVRAELLVVDMVVFGTVRVPLRRSGARVGDSLWVTGALGAPVAAIRAWEAGREPGAAARERFAKPVPRVVPAHRLRDAGATAMIDLSDGLLADAAHLAAASGVACRIEAERVPVHRGADGPQDALVGGEEYELLAVLPAAFSERDAATLERECGVPLTRVGVVEEGTGVVLVKDGCPVELPRGFRHFGGP
jgi:thiamine-monophosphate kinase